MTCPWRVSERFHKAWLVRQPRLFCAVLPKKDALCSCPYTVHLGAEDCGILSVVEGVLTLRDWRNSFVPEHLVQVGTAYAYGQLYLYIHGSPAEIQTPTPWKLIGRSVTALPPLLSPSSILSRPLIHGAFFPTRKNSSYTLLFESILFIYLFCNFLSLKLRKSLLNSKERLCCMEFFFKCMIFCDIIHQWVFILKMQYVIVEIRNGSFVFLRCSLSFEWSCKSRRSQWRHFCNLGKRAVAVWDDTLLTPSLT